MENLELELEKNRQTEIVEPYKLPTGWKWCKQSEVCKLVDGEKIADKEYPYLEVKYLRGTKEKSFVTSGKLIKKGTKVILVDGENSGEVFAIHEDGYMGSTFKALSIENVDENYLQYFITTKKDLYRNNKKGSAIPHLNKDLFKNMPFPLPPTFDEQQRIVNRIETMFAKLDHAQKKAQSVLDSFETRKAAILHKAFTGELTANWRKENGVSDDSWEEKRFDEVADIKSNLVDVAEYQDFPHIAPDNIEKKTGVLLEYHTVAEDKVKSGKHRFYAGQILYSKIRPYLSKVVVVNFDGVCSADMYPIEVKENTRFLWYQMLSNEFLDKASNSGSRSVLPKINQKELSIIPMRICSLPEQQEIVRIIDSVLEKETRAKEAAQTVLDQIALLKKSILARAFRGEL